MNRLLLLMVLPAVLAGCAREGIRPVLPYPRDTASFADVPDLIDDAREVAQEAR